MKVQRVLAVAAAAVAAVASSSAARADVLIPVGPDQTFHGLINGAHDNAVIRMVCPGPASAGQVGHPEAGQPVEVQLGPASTNVGGFTGSAANSIAAVFTPAGTTAQLLFRFYNAPQSIPTTIFLPCSGTGVVTFVPEPSSPTARSDKVTVTFVNIAV